MRQIISAIAAIIGFAVVGTAPAAACGYTPCGVPSYGYQAAYGYQAYGYQAPAYPPAYPYQAPYACGAGCATGYGRYERLAEPTTQYYYVNQGPTYTGPGRFAPYPTYQESAVTGYGMRRHHHYAGAGVVGPAVYGHRWHHPGHRWSRTGYYHGRPVLRRYN
jgi:hypothetical protein